MHTDRGTISTGACVIATGPVSKALAEEAGVDLPIETYLRHKLVMPEVPQVPQWSPLVLDGEVCGLYTVTRDHRPLIDETPVRGLYVNTGYSGHGVMCSVGGARLLIDRIKGARADTPFALDRTFVPPRGKTR